MLVAKSYTLRLCIVREETLPPVAISRSIRILIVIAPYYEYEIWQLDVKKTFLNGDIDTEIYKKMPEGFHI